MAQKMVYQWNRSINRPAIVDAQSVGERLESLRISSGGKLKKELVVSDATSEHSPLHPLFEWDDQKAANSYRLDQAAYLVRNINVVIEKDGKTSNPIRAFVSLSHSHQEAEYESIVVVANSPEKREILLKKALEELNQWRQRYAELQEFMRLHQAIDKMLLVIGKEATSAAQASA